jgi:hypothetical protein
MQIIEKYYTNIPLHESWQFPPLVSLWYDRLQLWLQQVACKFKFLCGRVEPFGSHDTN